MMAYPMGGSMDLAMYQQMMMGGGGGGQQHFAAAAPPMMGFHGRMLPSATPMMGMGAAAAGLQHVNARAGMDAGMPMAAINPNQRSAIDRWRMDVQS